MSIRSSHRPAPAESRCSEDNERIRRLLCWIGFALIAALAFPAAQIWISRGQRTVVLLAGYNMLLLFGLAAAVWLWVDRVLRPTLASWREQQAALQESEARYRRLLSSTTDYMYTVRVQHGAPIETIHSQGAAALTGYTPEEYCANPDLWDQIVHPSDRPALIVQLTNMLAGDPALPVECRIRHKDGSLRWLRMTGVVRRDNAGHIIAYDGLVSDVTERKEAETALRASENRFRTLLEDAPAAITLVREGRCLYRNKLSVRLFGADQSADPLAQAICQRQKHPPKPARAIAPCQEPASKALNEFETTVRCSDGSELPVHVSMGEVKLADGPATIAFLNDLTEHRRAEEVVRRTSEQLRALSSRLQTLREEERTRIAREIHDHLGQLLTALKLDLRSLERKSSQVAEEELRQGLNEKLASARRLADETITSVRTIAAELRPGALDRLGLGPAIQSETEAFEARNGIRCQFVASSELPPLPQSHATAMFRILQELLTNISRHAHATQVSVRLDGDAQALRLEVSDDGVGIRQSDLVDPKSLGLLGMCERATQLGGQVTFALNLKQGTRVNAWLPLRPPRDSHETHLNR